MACIPVMARTRRASISPRTLSGNCGTCIWRPRATALLSCGALRSCFQRGPLRSILQPQLSPTPALPSQPSTKHKCFQNVLSSPCGHPHLVHNLVASREIFNPKNRTVSPAILLGRFSPFLAGCVLSFTVFIAGPASIVKAASVCFLNGRTGLSNTLVQSAFSDGRCCKCVPLFFQADSLLGL